MNPDSDFHPAPQPRQFLFMEDEQGDRTVLYQTLIQPDCGCKVIGDGTLQHPIKVRACETHRRYMPSAWGGSEGQTEYNGWVNRETWAAALHLSNDEVLYNEAREIAGRDALGDQLEQWIESLSLDVFDRTHLPAINRQNKDREILAMIREVGSLWRVDWKAVRDSLFDEGTPVGRKDTYWWLARGGDGAHDVDIDVIVRDGKAYVTAETLAKMAEAVKDENPEWAAEVAAWPAEPDGTYDISSIGEIADQLAEQAHGPD